MSDNFETVHGRQVWKNPGALDDGDIFYRLRTSRPKWRAIASIHPAELDAAIEAATFLAAIEEDVLCPVDDRRSLASWGRCTCKLPSHIKPKVDYLRGHSAGLAHVCNVRQCASSAEGVRELVGLLRRSQLLSRFHLYTYDEEHLRLGLTWLVWSAWDRLLDAADGTGAAWAQALPGVVAELRAIVMRNTIRATTTPNAFTNNQARHIARAL